MRLTQLNYLKICKCYWKLAWRTGRFKQYTESKKTMNRKKTIIKVYT
jgi:hypothetical protein